MSEMDALRRKAAEGDPLSQLWLGQILLVGRQLPHAPEEGMRLIEAACGQSCADALLFHATLAALGHARPQSVDDALRLVSEAAALGDARAQGQAAALRDFSVASWFGPIRMRRRCEAPRIFTAEGFLPPAACAWLIAAAHPKLQAAPIKDPARGGLAVDAARTNTVAGSHPLEPDLVLQLARMRISAMIDTPMTQLEAANILHYAPGQEYRPHFDFIRPEEARSFGEELASMGQRMATVLVYLNDGYEGGETHFLRLDWGFKGKTGDALVFWNLSADGKLERDSMHAGLPVKQGEKWLLSQWVRQRPVPLI